MERLEETREPFHCPVSGRAVYVHRIWKTFLDFRGQSQGRACVRTSCEYQKHCVIASYTETGIAYDWDRCALSHVGHQKIASRVV